MQYLGKKVGFEPGAGAMLPVQFCICDLVQQISLLLVLNFVTNVDLSNKWYGNLISSVPTIRPIQEHVGDVTQLETIKSLIDIPAYMAVKLSSCAISGNLCT